jgi:xylulokinase
MTDGGSEMPDDRYLIAHDVGTGGSKAALCDLAGNILTSRFAPYETSYPRENWAEQNPDDWWDAVRRTTREVMAETSTSPDSVAGVIYSAQMIGVLPVDAEGIPLRPAIIWLDGRAQEQADKIVRWLTRPLLLAIAGGVPTGKDVIAKLMWLKQRELSVYNATHKILEVDSYLVHRSCGEFVYDYSAASATGCFNFKKKDWDYTLFKLWKLDGGKMPRAQASHDRAGGLTAAAADEMGLRQGTPVFTGTGDVASATVGSGALIDGQGHVYIGSSGWIAVTVPKAVNNGRKGIVSIASADPSRHILLSEMESAGACFKWFSEHLLPCDIEQNVELEIMDFLNEVASTAEPGSHGLLFTPWMYGERSPIPDTTVRGGFLNLSLDHRGRDMVRSVFEGVALHARWMLEGVRPCGFNDVVLRAIGGGAKSDLWMQIFADVLGVTIEAVAEPQHAGARGVALIAALGLGAYPDYLSMRNVVKLRKMFKPRSEYAGLYDGAFETFKESYKSLKKLYRRVNAERG